jgi:hypothetical protein
MPIQIWDENDKNKKKVIKVNENWDTLKAISNKNIQSERGIYYRQIRSIQTEGFFGDMKENDNFRKFNHKSSFCCAINLKSKIHIKNPLIPMTIFNTLISKDLFNF